MTYEKWDHYRYGRYGFNSPRKQYTILPFVYLKSKKRNTQEIFDNLLHRFIILYTHLQTWQYRQTSWSHIHNIFIIYKLYYISYYFYLRITRIWIIKGKIILYIHISIKVQSVKPVVDSDPDDPQPAPSQQKHTDKVDLVSKNCLFDYLTYLSLLVSVLWIYYVSINNNQYYVIIFKMTICSIARKNDIGSFVNCDLSDTDKNLVS